MRAVLFVAIAAMTLTISSVQAFDGPYFDVCESQVVELVNTRFAANVEHIYWDFRHNDRGNRRNNFAWVSTDTCSGYLVFRVLASERDCTGAHYGRVPQYVRFGWATGNCR